MSSKQSLNHVALQLSGKNVMVTLTDGSKLVGVLAIPKSSQNKILLRNWGKQGQKGPKNKEAREIDYKDVKDLVQQQMKTDTEISGNINQELQLKAWAVDSKGPTKTLEEHGNIGGWNQFEANKKLGVKSTYTFDQYTTQLDKKSREYSEYEAEAQKIANQINAQASSNSHLAEERGHQLEGEMDEEDRYSSVNRKPETSQAKYDYNNYHNSGKHNNRNNQYKPAQQKPVVDEELDEFDFDDEYVPTLQPPQPQPQIAKPSLGVADMGALFRASGPVTGSEPVKKAFNPHKEFAPHGRFPQDYIKPSTLDYNFIWLKTYMSVSRFDQHMQKPDQFGMHHNTFNHFGK